MCKGYKCIHKLKEKFYKEQFMINSNQLSKPEFGSGKRVAVKKKAFEPVPEVKIYIYLL